MSKAIRIDWVLISSF